MRRSLPRSDGAERGRGGVVIVEGAAGLGKSALLEAAGALAAERGARVLAARGGVLEQDVGWEAVRQLLEPVVLGPEAVEGLLDGAGRAARPVFGLAEPPAGATFPVDPAPGLEHALFRLVAQLAEQTLVVVSVDDAHWMDEASLRWLVYLARRAQRLSLLVVAARRLGEPSAHEALLDELAAVRGAQRLEPAPLSAAAARVLAEEAFSRPAESGFVTACREATGGNPFLLGELLGDLAAEGARPSSDAERRVRTLTPAAVVADVTRRLRRLSPPAVELARAVAILEGEAELRHAVALAGLPMATGEAAADELTFARLLRPARPLRFAHPILHAAVDAELAPARRAAAHRLAAALLDAEPELADRAAAHLLQCEPTGDAWVAQRLRAAGDRAIARGAPAAAVGLLERARREPSDDPALHLALGRAYRLAGRLGLASDELGTALAAWPQEPGRAVLLRELATSLAMSTRGEDAVALLEAEIAALAPADPQRSALLGTQLALGMLVDALVVDASARVERQAAGLRGATAAERLLLASVALIRARTGSGPATLAAEAADRALADGQLLEAQMPETLLFCFAALVLVAAGRDADAERWLRNTAVEAQKRGAELWLGIAELGLARVSVYRGDLGPAQSLGASALERALLGSDYGRMVATGDLLATLVECGAVEQADRLLAEHGPDPGPLPGIAGATTLLRGRMALRSAQRRHAEALADADELLARLERRRHGAPGPLAEVARVCLAAGERERARALAAEELARALRWDTPGAIGAARRLLGEVSGGEAGRRELEQAVALLEATPCRLELAKALLALGAARRRANRRADAREPLRRALDLGERCGAPPLVEAAGLELRACGARPRRPLLSGPDSLTTSERRVAELAARGLSNPDVAQTLVVSRSTVESHLRAVFRKLGVSARSELSAALEKTSPSLPDAKAVGSRADSRP